DRDVHRRDWFCLGAVSEWMENVGSGRRAFIFVGYCLVQQHAGDRGGRLCISGEDAGAGLEGKRAGSTVADFAEAVRRSERYPASTVGDWTHTGRMERKRDPLR